MSRVDKWHQKQQSKYICSKCTTTEIISLPLLHTYEKRKHSKKSFGTIFKIVITFAQTYIATIESIVYIFKVILALKIMIIL